MLSKQLNLLNLMETYHSIEDVEQRSLKSCHTGVKDILENLEVFSGILKEEPPVGPMICHPEIRLSSEELLVLNKGPKFMVRKDIKYEEFCSEVEKGVAKQDYNDIDGDEATIIRAARFTSGTKPVHPIPVIERYC